jgi:hypothetical protein
MQQVDAVLAAGSPNAKWIAIAFVIIAAGLAFSYELVWMRWVKPKDFVPSSNYAIYAGLFIIALAIERLLEPFSGLFLPSTDKQKVTSTVAKSHATHVAKTLATSDPAKVAAAQHVAAVQTKKAHWLQASRAVLMWAVACVLAMLACAALGVFLLRSVVTPTSSSTPKIHATKSPASDPNRWLDLLVTGLVVGAGTKPLHDLITQIQTSSSSSKSSASSSTTS